MTSRRACNLAVKAPGRWTSALSFQDTEPKAHERVGGEFPGIVKPIGNVYVPCPVRLIKIDR
jgi:hypothetical protein